MKKALAGTLTALALAAGSMALTTGSAAASYNDCPDGRVCVYEGWDGTGIIGTALACGSIPLPPGLAGQVSSVRTHGNAVTLGWDGGHAYVGPWTQTNLSLAENDRATAIYVHC